ncbi:MAG TPA: MoaD/ThiS family protein [Flavobacteriales bacterium]|nr:MoaD/ThiS family protein [Flavobacteriales bacterium]
MDVLLFGIIAERAGTHRLQVEASSTAELKRQLGARIDGMETLSYALAVDRVIVNDDVPLSGSEEIAVLPPFAGG